MYFVNDALGILPFCASLAGTRGVALPALLLRAHRRRARPVHGAELLGLIGVRGTARRAQSIHVVLDVVEAVKADLWRQRHRGVVLKVIRWGQGVQETGGCQQCWCEARATARMGEPGTYLVLALAELDALICLVQDFEAQRARIFVLFRRHGARELRFGSARRC